MSALRTSDEWSTRDYEGWCLQVWAQDDWPSALAEAEKDPDNLIHRVVDEIIRQDLNAAVSIMKRYPDNRNVMRSVFRAWGVDDYDAAHRYALSLTGNRRQLAFDALYEGLSRDNRDEALARAQHEEDTTRRLAALRQILPDLISEDPEDAARHIEAMPNSKSRYDLMKMLAKEKAKRDPEAAMRWAQGLEDPTERQASITEAFNAMPFADSESQLTMMSEIGLEMALPNPRAVTRTRRKNGSSGGYSHGSDLGTEYRQAVVKLAKDDPEKALRMAAAFPPRIGPDDFHPKDDLLHQATKAWLHGDQRDTELISLLEQLPNNGLSKLNGAVQGAPAEALRWVSEQIDQGVISEADTLIPRVAEEWLKTDSVEASRWISTLEDGSVKDRTIDQLVDHLIDRGRPDYEAAMLWSQTVGDEGQRESQLRKVFTRWKKIDAEAAETMLWALPVSDHIREDLINAEGGQP